MRQSAERSSDPPGHGYDEQSARHSRELKLVADLERLPGVVSAAVWLDDRGAVRDVRITASPVSPRIIVANAAAAVLRRHGFERQPADIHVDHARAPADDAVAQAPGIIEGGGAGARYLLLQELSIGRTSGNVTIAVQVACRGETFRGEATEMDTEAGRIRAAVRATLAAAQRVSDGVALGLEATSALDVFGRRFVAVSIEAAAGRRFTTLNGFVGFDIQRSVEEAAILATLRAIERWIAW